MAVGRTTGARGVFLITLIVVAVALASCEPPTIAAGIESQTTKTGTYSAETTTAPWAELGSSATLDLEEALLEYVNVTRTVAGLPPVALQQNLREAAQSHASFLVAHRDAYAQRGLSAHVEPADLPGFAGESFVDRVAFFGYEGHAYAEVVAFKPSSVAAGRSWMESLYHRLPMLTPAVNEVGYGQANDDVGYANVLEMGVAGEPDLSFHTVRWPVAGATAWDGKEVPQPQTPPGGYPSGPVITLQVTGASFVALTAVVSVGSTDLASTVLTWPADPNMAPDAVAVIPHEPLTPLTTYRVEITGTLDDEPFADAWDFTTGGDSCDPAAQDCGPGQACYVVDGAPRCLWAGTHGVDADCTHTNECAPGLSCFASHCRPLCAAGGEGVAPEESCEYTCLDETFALDDAGQWSLCLPPPCASDGGACEGDEACYWGGTFVCAAPGTKQEGDSCSMLNDCADGMACLGLGGAFTCRQLCGGDAYPSCDEVCPNVRFTLDADEDVSYCD